MLVTPWLVGLGLAALDGTLTWGSALVGPAFLVGYFAFNALTLWLKSPPRRRARYHRPVLAYSAATAALGLVIVALVGAHILWWTPVFAPLLGGALWLTAHKKERSLLAGALTVAASSLQPLVMWFTTPADVRLTPSVVVAIALFAYFLGTVCYVKSMIRKRGDKAFLVLSVCYHAACTVAFAFIAASGWASTWWTLLFALATARAWLLGLTQPTHPLSAKHIGFIEIGFTTAVLVIGVAG